MAIWWPWVSRGLHGGDIEAMGELCAEVWAVGVHMVRCVVWVSHG